MTHSTLSQVNISPGRSDHAGRPSLGRRSSPGPAFDEVPPAPGTPILVRSEHLKTTMGVCDFGGRYIGDIAAVREDKFSVRTNGTGEMWGPLEQVLAVFDDRVLLTVTLAWLRSDNATRVRG
jgi:hypothetical protein